MSAFETEPTNENCVGESNVERFMCSPKGSEKDFSLMFPTSIDKSFKLNSSSEGSDSFVLNSSNADYSNADISETVDNSLVEPEVDEEENVDQEDEGQDANQETDEQRREREERESQELAWQLMQEDNMEMYNMQLQFMQENADQLSEEDRQLMQTLVNESSAAVAPNQQVRDGGGDEEEDEGGDVLNDSDSSNWDYERLLQLGQQLGDVKTERWRLRAKSVIDSLPRRLYQDIIGVAPSNSSAAETAPITAAAVITVFNRCISPELLNNASNGTAAEEAENQSSSNKKRCIRPEPCPCTSSSPTSSTNATGNTAADVNVDAGADAGNIVSKEVDRCVVCMDDFQCDEELIVFPCRHYFHIPCTEGWLADHNFCPSCKTKVASSPEK